MKIGFLGLGKLGLPCALAIDLKGHDVIGYDINPRVMQKERVPFKEQGPNGEPSIEPLLRRSGLSFAKDIRELVERSELIFVPIQTPHEERYEGVTRLPEERKDFIYRWLIRGVQELAEEIAALGQDRVVIVISTVLPGTMRKYIFPVINEHVKICYNPFFIAMGTTMQDFLNPELVLLGVRDEDAAERVEAFYRTVVTAPVYRTTIENAETIKVAYNTYISMKIGFANALMELCHRTPGTDVDAVTDALKMATNRIISPKYLSGGMGDGGGCHPRDNIALSWLARQLHLSYDWFENLMVCREKQTDWLADLIEEQHGRRQYAHKKVGIYGRAFKASTNLTVGSPATLLANILKERGYEVELYDPHVDLAPCSFDWPGVYFVATNHREFADPGFRFPQGSIVIDPWRYIPKQAGVEVIHVGGANSRQMAKTA